MLFCVEHAILILWKVNEEGVAISSQRLSCQKNRENRKCEDKRRALI